MRRKGGEATREALAPRSPGLKVRQRLAGVMGRGEPCPEPETRAVLFLSKRSAQARGIVTRKGGNLSCRERSE